LAIEGFSHRYCSSKIGACLFEIHVFLTHQARKRFHLRGAFFEKFPRNTDSIAFYDEH
jgi:hypothetical protein